MEEPGGLQTMGSIESDTTERLLFYFSVSCIGEGNGNPLQCSCLENPRDGGAWWAAVCGVAQSWTRLKWRSSSSSSRELHRASLMAQQVKNLPAMQETQETWVQSLVGRPLGRYGNPLQYSCLENPTDRRARWATVHGDWRDLAGPSTSHKWWIQFKATLIIYINIFQSLHLCLFCSIKKRMRCWNSKSLPFPPGMQK